MEPLRELYERVAGFREAPAEVLALARAQAVAAAGAACTGARAAGVDPRADAEAAASDVARLGWDDPVLGGRAGLAGPMLAWQEAPTVHRAALATIVANEVGGRVGLACLRGEHAQGLDLLPAATGAAAAVAWLRGEGASGIEAAVHRAANLARRVDSASVRADPAAVGGEAVRAARSGVEATGALEAALVARTAKPCAGAFAGFGEVWLTSTLWVRRFPGPLHGAVALEALDEILRRHLKAADKRLRADQLELLVLRVDQPAWLESGGACGDTSPDGAGALDLRACAGALVARHALDAEALGAVGSPEVASVTRRTSVVHGWPLTVRRVGSVLEAVGPLLGGPSGVAGWVGEVRARSHWPCLGRTDALPLLRSHPERLLAGLLSGAADLGACRLEGWRWSQPVEVELHTTRGGRWPERREHPAGIGDDRRALAVARHPRGAELLALPPDSPMSAWREIAFA